MENFFKALHFHFKKRKHHVGYPVSALLFFSLGVMLAQQDTIISMPSGDKTAIDQEEAMMLEEEFVDPREVANTLRDITRQKSELKTLSKKAVKMKNTELTSQIAEISRELDIYAANIKKPPADYSQREALQEFYDARLWDEVTTIRAQVELPQILKDLPASVKRIEKLIKLKAYQKIGLDLPGINGYLSDVKEALINATAAYKEQDWEGAMGELEFMQGSGSPQELEGAIRRLKETRDRIAVVRDKEVKAQLYELIFPVTEAINDGDYRVAQQILNNLQADVNTIVRASSKMTQKQRTAILQKLNTLENKVTDSLDAWNEEQAKMEEQQNQEQDVEFAPQQGQMRPQGQNNMMPQQGQMPPQNQNNMMPQQGQMPPQVQNNIMPQQGQVLPENQNNNMGQQPVPPAPMSGDNNQQPIPSQPLPDSSGVTVEPVPPPPPPPPTESGGAGISQ
ncbi:MAG: hypothetical protein A2295_03175 [Candidatus Jacksonbacteria bacterium RIFOXYB2_FULL_44_15]|nr:MAG: hypothetical protein A2295_03175 [Candidatus Jacksonbacteria bacterium RIFOXYB2_FULL_44_15]OGY81442.1 MAG: hypothetical protein A2550_03540 [Candidatus Jacksonbacteria bacterium RIFOXYD2_FULL_43_21]